MASKVELDPKTGGIKGDTSEEVYQLEQVEFSEDESTTASSTRKSLLGRRRMTSMAWPMCWRRMMTCLTTSPPRVRRTLDSRQTSRRHRPTWKALSVPSAGPPRWRSSTHARPYAPPSLTTSSATFWSRGKWNARSTRSTRNGMKTSKGAAAGGRRRRGPGHIFEKFRFGRAGKDAASQVAKMRDGWRMPTSAPAALLLLSTNTDPLFFLSPQPSRGQGARYVGQVQEGADFHRMHHKRVVREKGKLIVDMKRLRKHYAAYEPTMKQLREKYELAMKEKMLMRLERG